MRITPLILMLTLLFTFTACDRLSLDDPQLAKLKAELIETKQQLADTNRMLAELKKENATLKQDNDLLVKAVKHSGNDIKSLIDERDELKQTVAKLKTKPVNPNTFTVKFANNRIYNKPFTARLAKKVYQLAKKHNFKVKIRVDGYATKIGEAKYNMWLSKERAEGVAHKIWSVAGGDASNINIDIIPHGEESTNARMVTVTVEIL